MVIAGHRRWSAPRCRGASGACDRSIGKTPRIRRSFAPAPTVRSCRRSPHRTRYRRPRRCIATSTSSARRCGSATHNTTTRACTFSDARRRACWGIDVPAGLDPARGGDDPGVLRRAARSNGCRRSRRAALEWARTHRFCAVAACRRHREASGRCAARRAVSWHFAMPRR